MLVRFLVGGDAGKLIDLPYAVAMANLRAGTAKPYPDVGNPPPAEATAAPKPEKRRRGRPRKR